MQRVKGIARAPGKQGQADCCRKQETNDQLEQKSDHRLSSNFKSNRPLDKFAGARKVTA
jgi:hypothetical protein